jgi:hypothetical protein
VASKKIFISIPWFLPAFRAGGPIQSVANLVKEFKEGVTYFIFCGDTDVNGSALENVETDKWVSFNDHTQVWYCSPEKISDSLVKQVEVSNGIDVPHAALEIQVSQKTSNFKKQNLPLK